MVRRRIAVSVFIFFALNFIHAGYSNVQTFAETLAWQARSNAADIDENEASPEEIEAEMALQSFLDPTLAKSEVPVDSNKPFVQVDVFKTPEGVGIGKEFLVVSVDGMVQFARAVSTATKKLVKDKVTGKMVHKKTIEGTFPLTYLKLRNQPWPWKTSTTYDNSPMYWGMNVKGGYYLHSTPHYYQLGTPASMGCVRLSFPTAMELFDLVVNVAEGNAKVTIHPGSNAKKRLEELKLDSGWLNDQIASDIEDALAVSKKDYKGYGHARRNQELKWPMCQTVDCFDYFGKKKPVPTPTPTPAPTPTPSPSLVVTR